jgi:hypothetical protein
MTSHGLSIACMTKMTPFRARLILSADFAVVALRSIDLRPGFSQSSRDAPRALSQRSFRPLQQVVDVGPKNHPLVQESGANLEMNEALTDQAHWLCSPQVYANLYADGGSARIDPRFVTPAGGVLSPDDAPSPTGNQGNCPTPEKGTQS